MIELTNGDENNLEGKVIIYSKLKSQESDKDQFIAMYVTIDPTEFFEKIGMPHEISDNIKEQIKELKRKAGVSPKKHNFFVTLKAPYSIKSKSDLAGCEEDVLYVGEYSSPNSCINALESGSELYLLNLNEQMQRKSGLDLSSRKKTSFKITYRDVKGENLRGYIIDNYLVPMSDALSIYNDAKEADEIKKEFMEFSKGAPFISDVFKICDLIEKNKAAENQELIDAHLSKIIAIHAEDYKIAATMRDRIKEMTK